MAQSKNTPASNVPANSDVFEIAENITGYIQDGKLILTVDLSVRQGESGSGKSVIVASTRGNLVIPGTKVTAGLNFYVKK